MSKKVDGDKKNNIAKEKHVNEEKGLEKEQETVNDTFPGENEENIKGTDTDFQEGEGEKGVEEGIEGEDELALYQKRVQDLEEENSSLKDQLLRKQAEYENFRKRLMKEKDEAIKYANQMLLLDMITIIDDFERAIKSSEESEDFNAFHDGIVLIEKQLVSILEKKWGVKRFDSTGETFDPDKHLAIAVEESDEYDISTVIEDYQKGYLFFERVLRPAKVKVAQPKSKEEYNHNTDHTKQESHNDKKQGG